MANIKDLILSADVDVQQLELLNTVGAMHNGTDILKNILATCETNVYHVTQQFHKKHISMQRLVCECLLQLYS